MVRPPLHADMETCRICRGEESDGSLRFPCKCTGSIRAVHEDCLIDWLARRYRGNVQNPSCELCGYKYVFEPVYSKAAEKPFVILAYARQIWRSSFAFRRKASIVLRAVAMVLVASVMLYNCYQGAVIFAEFLASPSSKSPVIRLGIPFANSVTTFRKDPYEFGTQLLNGLGLVLATVTFLIMTWITTTWTLVDPILDLEVFQLLAAGIELDNEADFKAHTLLVKELIRNSEINAQSREYLLDRLENEFNYHERGWLPANERAALERDAWIIVHAREERDEEAGDLWQEAEEVFGGPLLPRILSFFMFISLFAGIFIGVVFLIPYMIGFSVATKTAYSLGAQLPQTFEYRALCFLLGIAILLAFMEAPYLYFGRWLKNSDHGRRMMATSKQLAAIEKIWIIVVVETVVFPLFSGFLIHMAFVPVMADNSFSSAIHSIYEHHRIHCFAHWLVGTCYMYTLSDFFKTCRKFLRPGVLYFVQDPSDPKNEPIRNFLSNSLPSHFKKIGLSALIYSTLILGCIGSITVALRCSGIVPVLIAPLDLESAPGWSLLRYWFVPLVFPHMISLGVGSMGQDADATHNSYGWIFAAEFRRAASWLNLSSFLFNDQQDHTGDQGTYMRAPDKDNLTLRNRLELFVPVTADDKRLQPLKEGAKQLVSYHKVWRPRFFWVRIAVLVCWIWLVGAVIISSIILVPLLVGRGAVHITMTKDPIANDLLRYISGAFLSCMFAIVVERVILRLQTHQHLSLCLSLVYHNIIGTFMYSLLDTFARIFIPEWKEILQPSEDWIISIALFQYIHLALDSSTTAPDTANVLILFGLHVATFLLLPLHALIVGSSLLYTLYHGTKMVQWRDIAFKNYYIEREALQDYPA